MRKWVLFQDCFWAVVLIVMLVLWASGELVWYKATVPLAPFAVHLVMRSQLLRSARVAADANGSAKPS